MASQHNKTLSWSTCKSSGGPFASFIWQNDHNESLTLGLTLLLILINIFLAGALYMLSKLCDRKDVDAQARDRARKASDAIDEHGAASNRREVLFVKRTGLEQVLEEDSPGKEPTSPKLSERKRAALLGKIDDEIADLDGKLDLLSQRLEKLATNVSSTENMSLRLSHRKARAIVCCVIITLFVLSVPPIVLAPFAIKARMVCDRANPPDEHETYGLWIAYALLTILPTVLAWSQMARAAWHWKHPACGQCRGDRSAMRIETGSMDSPASSKANVSNGDSKRVEDCLAMGLPTSGRSVLPLATPQEAETEEIEHSRRAARASGAAGGIVGACWRPDGDVPGLFRMKGLDML